MSRSRRSPPRESDDSESELWSFDAAEKRVKADKEPPPDSVEQAQKIMLQLKNLQKFGVEGPEPDYSNELLFDKEHFEIEKEKKHLIALQRQLGTLLVDVRAHLVNFYEAKLNEKRIKQWIEGSRKQIAALKTMHAQVMRSKKIIYQLENSDDIWDHIAVKSDPMTADDEHTLREFINKLTKIVSEYKDPEPTPEQLLEARRNPEKVDPKGIDGHMRALVRLIGQAREWLKKVPEFGLITFEGAGKFMEEARRYINAYETHFEDVQLAKAAVFAMQRSKGLRDSKLSKEEQDVLNAVIIALEDAVTLCKDTEPTAETFEEPRGRSQNREDDARRLAILERELEGEIKMLQTWIGRLREMKIPGSEVPHAVDEAKKTIKHMVKTANKVRDKKAMLHTGPPPKKAENISKLREMLLQIWDPEPTKNELRDYQDQTPDDLDHSLSDTYKQAAAHRIRAMELIKSSKKSKNLENLNREAEELIAEITLTFMWMREAKATLVGHKKSGKAVQIRRMMDPEQYY